MRDRRWQLAIGAFLLTAGPAITLNGTPALAGPAGDTSPSASAAREPGQEHQSRFRATNAVNPPDPGAPGPPPSVTAVPFGPVFAVEFTAPDPGDSPITGYQYTTDDGLTWADLELTGTSPLRALVHGQSRNMHMFEQGTPYRIRIRAVNRQGPGLPSDTVEAVDPPDAPGPPPDLTVVPRAEGGVLLRFGVPPDNGSPITGWEYTTGDGAHWASLIGEPRPEPPAPAPAARLTAIVTAESTGGGGNLRPGREYRIRVRARNDVGAGMDSDTFAITLPNAGAPAAPTGIAGGLAGTDRIGVYFTAPGPRIIRYEYTTDDGLTWADVATTGNGPLRAVLNAESRSGARLQRDHMYWVRIRAVNGRGAGVPSGPVVIFLPSELPGAPVELRAMPGNQMIRIIFGDASDGGSTLFGYEYSTDDGGHWQWITGGTAITDDWRLTAHIHTESTGDGETPLSTGATYRVRLRARNTNGIGPDSRTVAVTLPNTGTPREPYSVTATPSGADIRVEFYESDPGDSPVRRYQFSTDDGITWSDVATTGTDPRHAVVTAESGTGRPLIRGKKYAIQIRAVNGRGPGAHSDPADITLPPGQAGAPGYTGAGRERRFATT